MLLRISEAKIKDLEERVRCLEGERTWMNAGSIPFDPVEVLAQAGPIRQKAGFSLKQAAELLGINHLTLRKWELLKAKPRDFAQGIAWYRFTLFLRLGLDPKPLSITEVD